jgi:hypothetical protein
MATIIAFSETSRSAETYTRYEDFYAERPGALFEGPIKFDRGVAYTLPNEAGSHVQIQSSIEGKSVRITVAPDRVTFNGRTYRFVDAVAFPGEHPTNIYPLSADVFLAPQTKDHPTVFCMQGGSNGSGEANRHTQIYLLTDPLMHKGKSSFLHLPSLLSSCRAISIAQDGKIVFPKNTYLFDDQQESRVGLMLSYYTFEGRRFTPIHRDIRLRFAHPEVPFQFEIQK